MKQRPSIRADARPLPMPPATAERVGYTAPHPSDTAATAPHLDGSSALHKIGIREYRAGRVAEAVASLTAALKLAPMHAAGWSDLGAVHAASGRFDEAMACYDRALSIRPNHVDALNNKGAALTALGRWADALASLDRALAVDSKRAAPHNNRGGVLRELGRLEEALASFDRALVLDRNHCDALNNRGNVLVDLGRAAEALESYDRALFANADFASALSNRGNALMRLGRPRDALGSYEKALALDPNSTHAHNNRGNALRSLERYAEASASFARALALAPSNSDALNNWANVMMELKRPDEALKLYDAALRVKPAFFTALSNRARALIGLRRPEDALTSVDRALALNPRDSDAHSIRGNALLDLDRHVEAIESYDRAIFLQPASPLPHNNKGIALIQQGRIDEGIAQFETAIGLDPSGQTYHNLAQSKRFASGDPILAAMEEQTRKNPPPHATDWINLHFALGKVFADVEDYERSFHHLSVGNASKRKQSAYDEANSLGNLARTRSTYAKELFARAPRDGNPSQLPVFIIGMPRSGSTLVEQILSSHRDVHGAGEIDDFHKVASQLGGPVAEALVNPEAALRISSDQFSRLAANYLSSIRVAAPTASRIVNKMLSNFCFVGLMALALPGARFIHVQRDPLDACISCFSTLFAEDIPYAYNLRELGRYYRAYEAVMEHWRTVLPQGTMIDVNYESVIADLEGEARRVVEHCGLAWDPTCLDFHRNQRSVRTASMTQVRRPLYNSSVGRWRAYERFLGPLLAEFEQPLRLSSSIPPNLNGA